MSKIGCTLLAVLLLLGLGGCMIEPRAGDLAQVSPGDYKGSVLNALGRPSSAEYKDNVVTLYYDLLAKDGKTEEYYVRLVDGYVQGYGKVDESAPGGD